MEGKVRVRFAPSPTGALHVGGVRTALFNYLFARRHGGEFLLRIEDTDQTRFVPGAEEYIIEALRWCGIEPDFGPHKTGPDAPYRQSERIGMYRQYAEDLIEKGLAYYAFDTPEEIEAMKERLKASGNKSPQYNGVTRDYMANSLRLPSEEVKRRLDNNEPYVIRVKLPRKEEIRFEDQIRGWVSVNTAQLDDKVLLKSDGYPTYHLANIVDDHLMHITHVIRGEEWLPSAPLHVFLYESFGWERPEFAHLPLLLSPDGNGKLSKRDGDKYGFPIFPLEWKDPATGVVSSGYRESGYLPEAFINFLALLGWNPGTDQEIFTLEELSQLFSLERVGKSGVKFDKKKSVWFNQVYIKNTPNEVFVPLVKEQLNKENIDVPCDEYILPTIDMLKERVEYLSDFVPAGRYFFATPTEYDPDMSKKWNPEYAPFLESLASELETISDQTPTGVEHFIKSKAQEQNIPIGKVMPMLRLAISGVAFGPGVFDIMAQVGLDEMAIRLRNAVQAFAKAGV